MEENNKKTDVVMAEIKLHTDIDCYIYIDAECYGSVKANSKHTIDLPIGAYWVEYVSMECEEDKYNFDLRWIFKTSSL